MLKAEPKTILNFLANYFDSLKDLFDLQAESSIIRKEQLAEILADRGNEILPQLLDYKILRKLGDDFEFRDTYFQII
jgi:hypothetical protein